MTFKKVTDSIDFKKNNGDFESEMIKGYRKMAKINIKLANEAILAENEASAAHEEFLSESENNDSEKGRYILC